MSMITVTARLTTKDLVHAVAQLTPNQLDEFVLRFDELQLARMSRAGHQAAEIADAYRLPIQDRLRVIELLDKNREEGLSASEEAELDAYMSEMDQRLGQVTDGLMALAQDERAIR